MWSASFPPRTRPNVPAIITNRNTVTAFLGLRPLSVSSGTKCTTGMAIAMQQKTTAPEIHNTTVVVDNGKGLPSFWAGAGSVVINSRLGESRTKRATGIARIR